MREVDIIYIIESLPERTAALIARAGYRANDPLVVGVQLGVRRSGAPPVFLEYGRTLAGEPLTAGTTVYTASLSKQITAACLALLVRDGYLDIESTLARWMPELPAWAGGVRLRHLVHHTGGLPEGVHLDALMRDEPDRTTAGVIRALGRLDRLAADPGTRFVYSNAGYVCLAVVVARAVGQPLPDFANEHLFAPLGMRDSRYWSGPGPHPPAAAPLTPPHPAPLSLGDGGVWSTAHDLMRWNQALHQDELGISALLHRPGHLDDGTRLDYAWALGVRTHAGHRIYRHGGSWPGLSAQLIRVPDRVPDQRASLVILALDDDTDRATTLANAMIEEIRVRPSP